MRTVKRVSEQLNAGKWEQLEAFVSAYAQEKQAHLSHYLSGLNFTTAVNDRIRRDELVKQGYVSPFGLQARAWKLALKDAHETVVKWYAVLAEEIRSRLFRLNWTKTQRHYAHWLLMSEPRLAALILSRAPLNPEIKLPSPNASRFKIIFAARFVNSEGAPHRFERFAPSLWMPACTRCERTPCAK